MSGADVMRCCMIELHEPQAAHLLRLRHVEDVRNVDLAAFQHRRARGGLRHALEDQPLHRRHLAPVALVGLHDQLDARRVAHELVGAEADRMLLEALVSDLLDIFLRHDQPAPLRERAVEGHEVGPRLVEMEAHAMGVDDLDLLDLVVQDLRALARWKLNFTSSAVKGSPLWNFSPSRSLNS